MRKTGIVLLVFSIWLWGCAQGIKVPEPTKETRMNLLTRNALSIDSIYGIGGLRIDYRSETLSIPFTMCFSSDGKLTIEGEITGASFFPFERILIESDSSSTRIQTPLGFLDLSETTLNEDEIYACLVSVFAGVDLILPLLESAGCQLGNEIKWNRVRLKLNTDARLLRINSWEAFIPERIAVKTKVSSFDSKTNRPLASFAVIYPYEIVLRTKYDSLVLTTRKET